MANTGVSQCSQDGYTIATINGVLTDDVGARENRDNLKKRLPGTFNNEPLIIEYFLNPTHLGGLGDFVAAVYQKAFENETVAGYDLVEMLRDASAKVKTQKLLLVAHSQGNFYANSFYDVVADKAGGVPSQSIGIYSVANPAGRVAGNGKWLTSDTDKVIAGVVARVPFKKIMPPNTHIVLQSGDDFAGHGFSEVYLKYRANKIVSDVQSSLGKLSSDPERREDTVCIDPPKITVVHKIAGVALTVVDPVATVGVKTVATTAKVGIFVAVTTVKAGAIATVWTYNTTVAATVWGYNTTVAVGKVVGNTAVAVSSTVYNALASALSSGKPANNNSNNSASAILATKSTQTSPTTNTSNTNNTNQALAPLTSSIIKKSSPTASPQPTAPTPTTAPVNSPAVAIKTLTSAPDPVLTPKLALVDSYTSSGGGGGGSSPQPATQVSNTASETKEIPPATTQQETIAIPNGLISATTTTQTYTENPVTFSGAYHNDATFDTIAFELNNTTLGTATSSFARQAEASTTREILSFSENMEIPSSGTWKYRIRLEDSVNASSTLWLESSTFNFTFATTTNTTTATNTATTTESSTVAAKANNFETPNPANLLYSDLNENGIADSEEDDVVATSTQSLPAGEYVFNNLTLTKGAQITAEGNPDSSNDFKGVKIFAGNLTIDVGSSISADGKGYDGAGPGSGVDPVAASYGGVGGGNTATSTYGSATKPIDLGSGMGSWRGGGSIRIVVANTFLNDGSISANGGGASASGGSIYVNTNILAGTGGFTANGSSAASWVTRYAGGGGRVAVYYKQSSFSGKARADSGGYCEGSRCGWAVGNPGTVFFVDVTTNDFYAGHSWRFQKNDGPFNFNHIFVLNGASVTMDDGVAITANELVARATSSLFLSEKSFLTIPKITIDGGTLISSGDETISADTLALLNGAVVTVVPLQTLTLSVPNIIISAGSSISADGKGYDGAGPGSGADPVAASYGGVGGGNTATSTYGSATKPIDLGSGMGSWRGGGSIRIVVANTFLNDGSISANGGGASASGGSIYVNTNILAGTGGFTANGSSAASWVTRYAGGGGRVAVYYKQSSFSGKARADSGGYCEGSRCGWAVGNPGTVVMEQIVDALLPPPVLSSLHSITAFNLLVATSTISGIVDETAHTISVVVPFGTDLHALAPVVIVSPFATSSPASGAPQDFTNPVVYTVTAEDGSTQDYAITVTVAPEPDTESPTITSYTFNNKEEDIVLDFATTTEVVIVLTASEGVDWKSMTIEDQNNPHNDKDFRQGDGCKDGTAVCTKIWDGTLSPVDKHIAAPDGVYRIKVHIKDASGNENKYKDYLSPYFITVKTATSTP